MSGDVVLLRQVLSRMKRSGLTWQEIANHWDGNRGTAYKIATGQWENPSQSIVEKIINCLPRHLFWKGSKELDSLVLDLLTKQGRLTGQQLSKLCGASDRTIRASIKRLREAGHKIDASMAPPQGYYLEEK